MVQVRQVHNHHGWDMNKPWSGASPAAAYRAEPMMLPDSVAAPVSGLPLQHPPQRMHGHALAPAGSLPGDMHLGGMAYGSAAMGARYVGADLQPRMPAGALACSYDEQQGSYARGRKQPPLYMEAGHPATRAQQQQHEHGQGQHSMYGCATGQAGPDTMDIEHITWSHRAPGRQRSSYHPFIQDPTFHQGYQHQGLARQQHLKHPGSGHAGRLPPQGLPLQGQLGAGLRAPARLPPMHAGGMDVLDPTPAYEGGQHSHYQAQAVNSACPRERKKKFCMWPLPVCW